MMRSAYAAFALLLFGQVALCAPTGALDADVFLQNGKDAQALNAKFPTLKASDSCNDGEMACIKDSIAHCVNATWELDACPKSLSCFALPSVRERGTVISCTSAVTAVSVIKASGAPGGIVGNDTNNSIDLPIDCNGDNESDDGNDEDRNDEPSASASIPISASETASESSRSATPVASDSTSLPSATSSPDDDEDSKDNGKATVTVTVVPTATLPSETFTLDPSEAASFLSSIATESGVIISTVRDRPSITIPPRPTASASVTGDASISSSSVVSSIESSPSNSVPAFSAPTTITLVGFAQPTSSASATPAGDSGYGAGY